MVLSITLALVIIIRIVKLILSQTGWLKNKIFSSWKEKRSAKQVKKQLEENKETIINPNAEDNNADEDFQEVIESAVAQQTEDEKNEAIDPSSKKDSKKNNAKDLQKSEEKAETSVFDKTTSLESPSEKNLSDKEKKQIERISIEAATLKNWLLKLQCQKILIQIKLDFL